MGVVSSSLCKDHRYPAEIVSHCVWLPPVHAELPRGRGDGAGEWGHRQLRDDPRVGPANSVRPSPGLLR